MVNGAGEGFGGENLLYLYISLEIAEMSGRVYNKIPINGLLLQLFQVRTSSCGSLLPPSQI